MIIEEWSAVAETEEYQNDLELVMRVINKSVGEQIAFKSDSTFLYLIGHLATLKRYYIRHFPDLTDLDETPFLNLLQYEVGFDLPITNALPLVELLRESKSWFENKGNYPLIQYIGDIVNSPITVSYPRDLLIQLSSGRNKLSGAITGGGELPIATTSRGRFHDGVYWANYTYAVVVEQSQNVVNFTDVVNLLFSVHPSGMKMFITFNDNIIEPPYTNDDPLIAEDWEEGIINTTSWATLDNGFKVSGGFGKLSMHGGDYSLTGTDNFVETTLFIDDSSIQRLSNDQFLHEFPPGQPWIAFSRFVPQGNGTYLEVFSSNDAIVYENVTTNVGLFGYPCSVVLNKTFRQLKDCAMLKDQQNMQGMWMQDLMLATFD